MKARKYIVLAALAVMVAALALVGCSSGASSSAASSGSDSSASASASASAEAAGDIVLLEEGKLIVATSPDYPPFENLENGEYVGLEIELIKAIGADLGLEVEFKTLDFNGIIAAIAAGGQADIAISGITIDPDRAKQVDFTDSYYLDDQAIAAMKNGEITEENADEMLNKEGTIIAVQSGTSGEAYVLENYPNATAQPYNNSTDAFAAMQAGQADAVCTNKAVVDNMLANAYQDAVVVKNIATGEEYGIAVSKDNPALTAAINESLAKLKADGTLDALMEKYL